MHFKILVFNYYFLTKVFENVFVNSFLHTDNDPMLTLTVTLNVCIACRRCCNVGVHLYVILATVSSGPAARSVFPQFPDWLTWDNLSELSEMAWSDFFLHISPALRNEIRRSQIDGWLTGVDRHIALTSVKKLRRANRWLSPTVQLFPFADTDCCACKKSRSVKNIHLCRGGDGGFLLVLDERNREQAPTLFALPKQVRYPRVKQHLHGPLERSAHSSYLVFPRNAHRFCTTQSEKDKTTQISKIQIYMVPCTCRRRGRAPFSLNFLSTDQTHASGRDATPHTHTHARVDVHAGRGWSTSGWALAELRKRESW